MSDSGKKILLRFKRRWLLWQGLESLLYGLGPAVLLYVLTFDRLLALVIGAGIAVLVLVLRKPWRLTLERIVSYVDAHSDAMQHSTGLLLLPENQLSNLARLQRHDINRTLSQSRNQLRPQVSFRAALAVFALFAVLAFVGYTFDWTDTFQSTREHPDTQKLSFQPLDSSNLKKIPPVLTSQKLTIRPPSYTKLKPTHQSKMPIRALKGSRVFWNLQFDAPVDSVVWESPEERRAMTASENGYSHSTVLQTSGFYNFGFTDTNGASYRSELYAIEVYEDEPPVVDVRSPKVLVSFAPTGKKIVDVKVSLSDDYGLQDVYIVATVSKGKGESVKFREERLSFDGKLNNEPKRQDLGKQIDLDQLGMDAGDELYFYIGATDNKRPRPNTTRSETFFAVIEDSVSDQFAVESTMGADLMPAYFRSQRQLIIDTEKLIADRDNMPTEKFNATSNALGADQKMLRLKYGQFMGDESDSGIQGGPITLDGDPEVGTSQENHSDDDDPTAAYTHNHDADEEHSAVGHSHEGEEGEEESPLENYLHNHDNPEESTLFTQSLKSQLRQAMNQMWDAELQLRLHHPQKSLPFQYRALKLLQDIKNSSRIYVHRIGFDAPPIKESSRLTGDIASVGTVHTQENREESMTYPAIRKAVERLEILIQNGKTPKAEQRKTSESPTGKTVETSKERSNETRKSVTTNSQSGIILGTADRTLLEEAGKELAALAVHEPGKHLETLQELRWLADMAESDPTQMRTVRDGLLKSLPSLRPNAARRQGWSGGINKLMLQELDTDD
ncbi:tryptophan-rich sensory protein [Pricia sp. S334]|uniref:Tryptophan-rich sensory protein n=1 Tax=Pricia mediterranea TaxID=3076079 RepID=A0ABU3L2T5_9FLAO|nr:tryptophan-rich sensory protein [Pricia sp. S334]MDT7827397.1 tryptophan-rich sensory protein [Pricia sp. S334]